MKTDGIWYKLFLRFPGIFFELTGYPSTLGLRYKFVSVEVKELAFRIDGVFVPKTNDPDLLICFAEAQLQYDADFYSRFLTEIYNYLRQHQPPHDWRAAVLFPNRQTEPPAPPWYQEYFDSGRVQRIYLEELPETGQDSVGLGAIQLIMKPEDQAGPRARQLIAQTQQELTNPADQRAFIELLETILVYKLPHKGREEIEAMLGLSDLKETKVYQEAKQEGVQQGVQQGLQQGEERATAKIISRLLTLGLPMEQIAAAVDMNVNQVQQFIEEHPAD